MKMTTDDVVHIASNLAARLGSTGVEPHARRANGSARSWWCGSPGMQRARVLQRAVVQRDRRKWRTAYLRSAIRSLAPVG